MNPLNRITQRIARLGRQIADSKPKTIAQFERDDHQPDGTVRPPRAPLHDNLAQARMQTQRVREDLQNRPEPQVLRTLAEVAQEQAEVMRSGKVLAIKPPLGVMPRHLWVEARMRDLAEAARLHCEAGQYVPEDIVHELMDHSAALELGKRLKPTPDPITIEQAMRRIGQALFMDEGYALGWHANLAMAAHDAMLRDWERPENGLTPAQRNAIADLILERFFGLPPIRIALRGNELDVGERLSLNTIDELARAMDHLPWRSVNGPEALENPETWTGVDLAREIDVQRARKPWGQLGRSPSDSSWLVRIPMPSDYAPAKALRSALEWVTGIEDPCPVIRLRGAMLEVVLKQTLKPRCHMDGAEVIYQLDEASAVEGAGFVVGAGAAAQAEQREIDQAVARARASLLGGSLNSKAEAQFAQAEQRKRPAVG